MYYEKFRVIKLGENHRNGNKSAQLLSVEPNFLATLTQMNEIEFFHWFGFLMVHCKTNIKKPYNPTTFFCTPKQ